MKNILVPVDLSIFSKEIIEAAVQIARLDNGKLILLNVASVDVGFIIGDVGFQYLPELEETALKEDAKRLSDLQKYAEEQGVECVSMIKQGIPVDTILEQSDKLNIDLIVIGSRGHGSLYEALVGSVCHDVLKHTKVPVYVLPNKKK